MAVEVRGFAEVRAYLEYFRELGVYDFYRNGNAGAMEEDVQAEARVVETEAVAAPSDVAPEPLGVIDTPLTAVAVPTTAFERALEAGRLISFNDLAPHPETRVPVGERFAALAAIREDIGDCTRCPLAYGGRRTIVFGDGDPAARLMFVGEGPGADEDAQGIPFVGKSGQLLNNMIGAMGLKREQVYIANIVKCRPTANRTPEPVEANTCTQFLLRQMDVVQPEFVVALGGTAALYLLGVKQPLNALRGRFHEVRGAKCAVTYHPAFLLRDPRQKAEAWKDLQMVMAAMGLKGK